MRLKRKLGCGGQAAVYKAKFHGKRVAIKFIPTDKETKRFDQQSYGCAEYVNQERFHRILIPQDIETDFETFKSWMQVINFETLPISHLPTFLAIIKHDRGFTTR